MPLETATYIDELVSTNPVGSDDISQGDDHIRLLKDVLLQSFPNISGAMTVSHTILNGLDGRVTTIEGSYIKKDGSVAMTGNLDLGTTNKIVNVSDPTVAQDAATKAYVDAQDALALQAANNLSDIASAVTARSNLGLGSLATQNSINNGDWSGADLAVGNGGTGSSTAAGARANLGTIAEPDTKQTNPYRVVIDGDNGKIGIVAGQLAVAANSIGNDSFGISFSATPFVSFGTNDSSLNTSDNCTAYAAGIGSINLVNGTSSTLTFTWIAVGPVA